MTTVVPGVVEVAVIRRVGRAWRVLTLERAQGTRSPGAWEVIHGHIEKGETPVQAALREVREETGLVPERVYSIGVNPFFLPRADAVQLAVAFAAVVTDERFRLSAEHVRGRWAAFGTARTYLAWPRTHELLRQVAWMLRTGDAGVTEDVLLVAKPRGR